MISIALFSTYKKANACNTRERKRDLQTAVPFITLGHVYFCPLRGRGGKLKIENIHLVVKKFIWATITGIAHFGGIKLELCDIELLTYVLHLLKVVDRISQFK